jgi:hypothetical protein
MPLLCCIGSPATHAPYRLLEEIPDLSSGNRDTGNMLIQGDNLDALKALQPYYAGKVKASILTHLIILGQLILSITCNGLHLKSVMLAFNAILGSN